jgi:hypothetical protein
MCYNKIDKKLINENKNKQKMLTKDFDIRSRLILELKKRHAFDKKIKVVEELGVHNGEKRVDIAVVNGIFHGYEIKSDKDNLLRLPQQIKAYNQVFDRMTLVVGKQHLKEAFEIVPDWWEIIVAKFEEKSDKVVFLKIREGELNRNQNKNSVARLLWREEALDILKKKKLDNGFFYKNKSAIYDKLTASLDSKTLSKEVRETIFFRDNWKPDWPLALSDG